MKTPFTYYILTILCCLPLIGQTQFVTISGIISSEKTGKIMENANIFDSQSKIGTISDKSGFYQLMLQPGKIDLLITHDGFTDFRQKMVLQADTTITITLRPAPHLKGKQKSSKELQASVNNDSDNLKHDESEKQPF